MNIIAELYPMNRSITGPGVRDSLAVLDQIIDLEISEVPSGSAVLDWSVPQEWIFREAWIEDESGRRVIDSANSNLHVVNYSIGVDQILSKADLEPHLFSLPDRPQAIPYRTAYYDRSWGFCLSEEQRQQLGDGPFRARIDAEHIDGSLTYAEHTIRGTSRDEVLVSTHICHPSLANDNLSGMVLAAALAKELGASQPRLTWRFVFVPGTIGAISWLAENRDDLQDITDGLVLTGLGDLNPFTWKQTRQGNNRIDKLMAQLFLESGVDSSVIPFGPYGYDERQYSSPGFDLPVGRLTRGVHGTFPQYHTSDDNLSFVTAQGMEQAAGFLLQIAQMLESDRRYMNLQPYGEPMLGRRGLYSSLGGLPNPGAAQMAMLWLLNQSDGERSLLEIASKSEIPMLELAEVAEVLVNHDLLAPID